MTCAPALSPPPGTVLLCAVCKIVMVQDNLMQYCMMYLTRDIAVCDYPGGTYHTD